MGDTGSLALGGAVGTTILMVRKELLLPLLGIVYFAEAVSVILQTGYFKYTRRRTGTGERIFRMAPLHHHFEALGLHEAKIVTRFWIVTAITVIAALLSLRLR
jgi:phospho-N-acetylmuramoyl-pentapeptide-transferase